MPTVRYGTSSWSEKSWVGCFYPTGCQPADFLKHYCTQFDTVEVDATYYRRLGFAMAEGWVKKTPESFLMASKYPQQIMLGTDDPRTIENAENVLLPVEQNGEAHAHDAALGILGPRLGPVVIQLPYFKRSVFPNVGAFMEKLGPFLGSLNAGHRYVLEVRNPTFLHEELFSFLRERNVAFCLTNVRGMPHPDDVAQKFDVVTTDFFYGRLIGDRAAVEKLTKSFDRVVLDRTPQLEKWAHLVRVLATDTDGFVYANNHFAGHGPTTIRHLQALVGIR
jgi:uncharacterized protein YecE (DUF72 family)